MKIQTKEKPLNITNINFMYDENTWKRIRNEDIKHKLDSLLLNIFGCHLDVIWMSFGCHLDVEDHGKPLH